MPRRKAPSLVVGIVCHDLDALKPQVEAIERVVMELEEESLRLNCRVAPMLFCTKKEESLSPTATQGFMHFLELHKNKQLYKAHPVLLLVTGEEPGSGMLPPFLSDGSMSELMNELDGKSKKLVETLYRSDKTFEDSRWIRIRPEGQKSRADEAQLCKAFQDMKRFPAQPRHAVEATLEAITDDTGEPNTFWAHNRFMDSEDGGDSTSYYNTLLARLRQNVPADRQHVSRLERASSESAQDDNRASLASMCMQVSAFLKSQLELAAGTFDSLTTDAETPVQQAVKICHAVAEATPRREGILRKLARSFASHTGPGALTVLHGPSGVGKAGLACQASMQAQATAKGLAFASAIVGEGGCGQGHSLRSLIASLCEQLRVALARPLSVACANLENKISEGEVALRDLEKQAANAAAAGEDVEVAQGEYDEQQSLVEELAFLRTKHASLPDLCRELAELISLSSPSMPLLCVVGGLDLVAPEDRQAALSLSWLPYKDSQAATFVITVNDDSVDSVRRLHPDATFKEVAPLDFSVSQAALQKLEDQGRKLGRSFLQPLNQAMDDAASVSHHALAVTCANCLHAWTSPSVASIASDTSTAFNQVMGLVATRHGQALVQHTLTALALCRGLPLADLCLSAALSETVVAEHASIQGSGGSASDCRAASLAGELLALLQTIQPMLLGDPATYGMTLAHHELFECVVEQLSSVEGVQTSALVLAQHFSGAWHGQDKPAAPAVPPCTSILKQSLSVSSALGMPAYNAVRLEREAFLWRMAQKWDVLWSQCLSNFNWMDAALRTSGPWELVDLCRRIGDKIDGALMLAHGLGSVDMEQCSTRELLARHLLLCLPASPATGFLRQQAFQASSSLKGRILPLRGDVNPASAACGLQTQFGGWRVMHLAAVHCKGLEWLAAWLKCGERHVVRVFDPRSLAAAAECDISELGAQGFELESDVLDEDEDPQFSRVCFSSSIACVVWRNGKVVMLSMPELEPQEEIDANDQLRDALLTQDGSHLILLTGSAAQGKVVSIALAGESDSQLEISCPGVQSISTTPDGAYLLMVTSSGESKLLETKSLAATKQTLPHPHGRGAIVASAYLPTCKTLAVGSAKDELSFWTLQGSDSQRLTSWRLDGKVSKIATHAATARVAAVSSSSVANSSVCIFDAETAQLVQKLPLRGASATTIAFSHDGSTLYVGYRNGTLATWDVKRAQEFSRTAHFPAHSDAVDVLVMGSGVLATATSNNQEVHVWTSTGRLMHRLELDASNHWLTLSPSCVGVSPDGKVVATGYSNDQVCLWNTDSGTAIGNHSVGQPLVGILFVTSDQEETWCVVVAARDVLLLNPADASLIANIPLQVEAGNFALSVAPQARRQSESLPVATRSDIRVMNLMSKQVARIIPLPEGELNTGRMLQLAGSFGSGTSEDSVVWIRNEGDPIIYHKIQAGEELELERESASCFAISPDGALVACGLLDGGIVVWDVVKGSDLMSEPAAHSSAVTALMFRADGAFASGGQDGAVKFFVRVERTWLCTDTVTCRGSIVSLKMHESTIAVGTGAGDVAIFTLAASNALEAAALIQVDEALQQRSSSLITMRAPALPSGKAFAPAVPQPTKKAGRGAGGSKAASGNQQQGETGSGAHAASSGGDANATVSTDGQGDATPAKKSCCTVM